MEALQVPFGLRARMAVRFLLQSKNVYVISWPSFLNRLQGRRLAFHVLKSAPGAGALEFGTMKIFGSFRFGDRFFWGELRGESVHVLAKPYWLGVNPTGEVLPCADLKIDVPIAPSKLIAVGLNYSDHIAEMKRTPLGTPLIWFKAPSSLLPHNGTIEVAFPEHQTDFEVELSIVIGASAKNVPTKRALDHVFGYTVGLDISDRDLQKSEKQFGRCKSFDTYTPIGPFVYADAEVADVSLEFWQNGELRQST